MRILELIHRSQRKYISFIKINVSSLEHVHKLSIILVTVLITAKVYSLQHVRKSIETHLL